MFVLSVISKNIILVYDYVISNFKIMLSEISKVFLLEATLELPEPRTPRT